MATPFVAEIRIFPFDFAPSGWAQCNGQLMAISQNTALFSLLGTTYGGDGRTTFALPNLQGRASMHPGQGPGLSQYDLGQVGGVERVTIGQTEAPAHNHVVTASAGDGNVQGPDGQLLATGIGLAAYGPGPTVPLNGQALTPGAGGQQPHNNMQPYLTVNYCIALQGIFPSRP